MAKVTPNDDHVGNMTYQIFPYSNPCSVKFRKKFFGVRMYVYLLFSEFI